MSNIVALWQDLLDYDKQRVVFAARHQSTLTTGRFKSPKKRVDFTPGVESVKRHALTSPGPLPQWPSCCRLIETIFVRLCNIHRSPKKKQTGTVSRWDLVLLDYRNIRRQILGNGAVMQLTNLQLVDVSYTTLVQWYNSRVKRQDTQIVKQGLDIPSRLSVAADPLPPANVRPQSREPPPGPSHQYAMPSSTVGQAKVKRKVLTVVTRPTPAPTLAPTPAPTPASQRPILPAWPSARPVVMLKCGQFRIAETGHSQYKGVVYCPAVETLPKEQWLEQIKKQKD